MGGLKKTLVVMSEERVEERVKELESMEKVKRVALGIESETGKTRDVPAAKRMARALAMRRRLLEADESMDLADITRAVFADGHDVGFYTTDYSTKVAEVYGLGSLAEISAGLDRLAQEMETQFSGATASATEEHRFPGAEPLSRRVCEREDGAPDSDGGGGGDGDADDGEAVVAEGRGR